METIVYHNTSASNKPPCASIGFSDSLVTFTEAITSTCSAMYSCARRVVHFIFEDGHIVALSTTSIVVIVCQLLSIAPGLDCLACAYLVTYIPYALDRGLENVPLRGPLTSKSAWCLVRVSSASALLGYLLLAGREWGSLVLVVVLVAVGVLYGSVLKGLTKKIPGFKNAVVALTFTLGLALPMLWYGKWDTGVSLFIGLFVFLRYFVCAAFYDLKDRDSDRAQGLRTLAVLIDPPEKFHRMLVSINMLSGLFLLVGIMTAQLPLWSAPLLFVVPFFNVYAKWGMTAQGRKLKVVNYVLCDGEFILWIPLSCAGRVLLGGA